MQFAHTSGQPNWRKRWAWAMNWLLHIPTTGEPGSSTIDSSRSGVTSCVVQPIASTFARQRHVMPPRGNQMHIHSEAAPQSDGVPCFGVGAAHLTGIAN